MGRAGPTVGGGSGNLAKGGNLVCKGTRTEAEQVGVYQFMLANQIDHSVVAMCRVLCKCRCSYYKWKRAGVHRSCGSQWPVWGASDGGVIHHSDRGVQ